MEPHFKRHPKSAPGDFYVVNGECVCCGAPHVVGPDLIAWADHSEKHCIWRKQPENPSEVEQASAVLDVQCVGCHRYGGTDPTILSRVSQEYCDFPVRPCEPFSFGKIAGNANTCIRDDQRRLTLSSRIVRHLRGLLKF